MNERLIQYISWWAEYSYSKGIGIIMEWLKLWLSTLDIRTFYEEVNCY